MQPNKVYAQNENGDTFAVASDIKQLAHIVANTIVPVTGLRVGVGTCKHTLTRADAYRTFLATGCLFDGMTHITLVRQ